VQSDAHDRLAGDPAGRSHRRRDAAEGDLAAYERVIFGRWVRITPQSRLVDRALKHQKTTIGLPIVWTGPVDQSEQAYDLFRVLKAGLKSPRDKPAKFLWPLLPTESRSSTQLNPPEKQLLTF
jgi:hypothetical protein